MSGLLPAVGGSAGNVLQLAAGALSGVLAMSALIASGVVSAAPGPAPAQANLEVTSCGDHGTVLGVARPGDQLWVTGRSPDGAYLRVHVPGPIGVGWVPSAAVNLLSTDPVPVVGCAEVARAIGTPGPTAVPASATPTTIATVAPTMGPTAKPLDEPTAPTSAPLFEATATPAATPNVGPIFTINPPQVAPTRIGTNPLGTGNCGRYGETATVKTAATDPDTVAEIQLWVQKPSARSFVRLSHGFTKTGAYWNGSIDTAKDRITIAGTLHYRAVAIDTKGAATTSRSGSLAIFRCDTEANINGGINLTQGFLGIYILQGETFSIPWRYTLSDADGLARNQLTYTITHAGAPSLEDTITLTRPVRSLNWTGRSNAPASSSPYDGLNTVTWTLTTFDNYRATTSITSTAYVSFAYVAIPK
jgi:hypothetical protein